MKVLMVNGSGRANSTTAVALAQLEKVFLENGIEVEIVSLSQYQIKDCMACNACRKFHRCVMNDIVNEFAIKADEADGFIFASPTYYAHASGRLLSFMDRLFYSSSAKLAFKPAAAVTVARRGGNTSAFDDINKYFTINQMPIVSSTYWNMVFGLNPEDAIKDKEGLQTMRNLARNMIYLMRCIQVGKEAGVSLPENEHDSCTNFIR